MDQWLDIPDPEDGGASGKPFSRLEEDHPPPRKAQKKLLKVLPCGKCPEPSLHLSLLFRAGDHDRLGP